MQGIEQPTSYVQNSSFSVDSSEKGSSPCRYGARNIKVLGKRKYTCREMNDYCHSGCNEAKKRKTIPDKSELGSIGNGLIVKHSSLPGSCNGVFVSCNFIKGQYVTWYEGLVLEVSSEDRKELLTDYGYWSHLISIDQFTLIQGIKKPPTESGVGLGSLINDGPVSGISDNVEYVKIPDRKAVYIRAKRFIKKGEELFINYGKSYWDRFQRQFPEEYERIHIGKSRVRIPSFKILHQNT